MSSIAAVTTIEHGGRTREYLRCPPRAEIHRSQPGSDMPPVTDMPCNTDARPALLIAMHGGGSDAYEMESMTGLAELTGKLKLLVIFPQGTGRDPKGLTWNAEGCCGHAQKRNVDDVGFISAIINRECQVNGCDPARVFLVGFSNGGMMCYRMLSEAAGLIRGVIVVAGASVVERFAPTHPVPVVHMHGTADEFVPYTGGRGHRSPSGTNFPSVAETMAHVRAAMNCDDQPVVESPAAIVDDGTRVEITRWTAATTVMLYTIHGAGHTWPGRKSPRIYLGAETRNLVANDVIEAMIRSAL